MKCNKCGIDKPIEEFYNGRRACKGCIKEYHKKNAELIKEYHKKNAEQIKEYQKEWRKNNAEHIKEQKKEYNKEYSKNLSDGYIKRELKNKGYPPNQITPELIEVKRLIIKTKRLCKTSQS